MPDWLEPIPFSLGNCYLVDPSSWCGDEVWAAEATLWIQGSGAETFQSTLDRGGKVWVYRNGQNEIVGFGALDRTHWDFNGDVKEILYIPMLGVFTDFQGRPIGAGGDKYCYQIIDHLLDEAEEDTPESGLLGLSVHPENRKAIHVYEKTGFAWWSGDEYSRMVIKIG
jgi:ribosomal protein S18 acetylase RimI-like enzyme